MTVTLADAVAATLARARACETCQMTHRAFRCLVIGLANLHLRQRLAMQCKCSCHLEVA